MFFWRFFINLIPAKAVRKKLKRRLREAAYRAELTKKAALSCDIGNFDDLLARGTKFPHLTGIVISRFAVVGRGCTFYQNVTVGAKNTGAAGETYKTSYPEIGDNVVVYAGACIAGPVKIGDNAVIGANAVVLEDVPAGCTAAGIPAKIIRHPQKEALR